MTDDDGQAAPVRRQWRGEPATADQLRYLRLLVRDCERRGLPVPTVVATRGEASDAIASLKRLRRDG